MVNQLLLACKAELSYYDVQVSSAYAAGAIWRTEKQGCVFNEHPRNKLVERLI